MNRDQGHAQGHGHGQGQGQDQRHQGYRYPQRGEGRDVHRHRNDNELTPAKLQELLSRDPNEITLSLGSNMDSFRELINEPMDYDLTELFIKVLQKSMKSISLKEKNNQIISIIIRSGFPSNISEMLGKMNFTERHVEFLLNLMYIVKIILMQNPSEYVNTLQIIFSIGIIFQDPDLVRVEILEDLLEKHRELQRLSQELAKKNKNQETETVSSLPEVPLKEIKEDDMPFKDYIIYGKPEVKAPNYLTQQTNLKMDLSCLIGDCQLVFDSRLNVVTQNRNSEANLSLNILEDAWPDAEDLKLNDSQLQALQNALTKEFSLTQGPPGTGKTYIGLKIVKTLCSNSNLWRTDRKSPILIVCYTNQALDKFLEGITSFLERGIVRVGSRSKCKVLKKYLLNNLRRRKRFTRELMSDINNAKDEKITLKSEIEQMTEKIKHAKKEILHEDILKDHMKQFYDWLVKGFKACFHPEANRNTCMLRQWLGYGDIEIGERDIENPDDDNTEAAEHSAEEDNVELDTEADFIQRNRMIDVDDIEEQLPKMEITGDENIKDLDRTKQSTEDGFEKTKEEKKRLKKQLKRLMDCNTQMTDEEVEQIHYDDLWVMKMNKRWELYRRWVASYCQKVREEILQKEIKYDHVSQVHQKLRQQVDGKVMKNSLIIGMTTTAAARYHALLQEIRPKIIIVEEAAEILEAHVVTALNPMCEQIILIGDHKQLSPNANFYELARNYNLEVSLFERMVLNKYQVKCLSDQHRMRPEISQLLRPIYPELQDHPSVMKYENIKGVASNVYFIQYNEPEVTNVEVRSYRNPHEASLVVELCKYLLKQGYSQSQITILTTYTAQLFELKKLMKNTFFKGVHLTVVDNFQGEENDIILLSMVRNNVKKRIDFLKNDNRVCVALSRAKMGFYVFGNIEVFSEQTKLWNSILQISKSKNLIGYSLTLCCQNHPDRNVQIRNAFDFNQSPEGGCLKPCESHLKCGHTCKRHCHPVDDHDEYKCLEICPKMAPGCPDDHRCTHVCSEKCKPCMKMVVKIIPNCNHQQRMACSADPSKFKCENPCEKHFPCGHQCKERCGYECSIRCMTKVSKKFPCNHIVKTPCYQSVCPEKCRKRLDCGHECSSTCGECSDRRIHLVCTNGCGRLLVCGHKCLNRQCNVCSPCWKSCENRCVHNKCIKLCGELCIPCNEPCAWRCEHHKCSRLCHEPCDRPKCNRPCLKILPCNHPCVGLCGEKCPRLCRVCNKEELTEIFFGAEDEEDACFVELEDCGHILEKSALDLWMAQETDGEIQLKVCPKCKVPIRRNLRYGQIINKTLMDINVDKEKLLGDRRQINKIIRRTEIGLHNLPRDYHDHLLGECRQLLRFPATLYHWTTLYFRIRSILALGKLTKSVVFEINSPLKKHCLDLSEWLLCHKETLSYSQLKEITIEIERIGKLI